MGIIDQLNDFLDGDPDKKLEKLKTKSSILDLKMEIEEKKRRLKEKQKKL